MKLRSAQRVDRRGFAYISSLLSKDKNDSLEPLLTLYRERVGGRVGIRSPYWLVRRTYLLIHFQRLVDLEKSSGNAGSLNVPTEQNDQNVMVVKVR